MDIHTVRLPVVLQLTANVQLEEATPDNLAEYVTQADGTSHA